MIHGMNEQLRLFYANNIQDIDFYAALLKFTWISQFAIWQNGLENFI